MTTRIAGSGLRERLLAAVSSLQSEVVRSMKQELRRQVYDEQVRGEKRKVGGSLVEAAATGALKPWREVITPHADVASGRYQQAEFAADLWQVHLGEGSDEYRKPLEFFRRTFLTESLKQMLVNGVKRLSGTGGDPVVQLQTNFGGGKTHSMLALYHLFSGVAPGEDSWRGCCYRRGRCQKPPQSQPRRARWQQDFPRQSGQETRWHDSAHIVG